MYSIDTTGLVLLIAISASAGMLVGVLLSLLRGGEKESFLPGRKLGEMLRLWRDLVSGALVVRFNNQVIEDSAQMTPEQGEQLRLLLHDLSVWSGVRLDEFQDNSSKALVEGKPLGASTLAQQPTPLAAQSEAVPAPVNTRPDSLVKELPVIEESLAERPRIRPVRVLEQLLGTEKSPSESTRPVSIVAQVDEILQEMIKPSELAKRGIKLIDVPGRGMLVMVGVSKYESVNDVPDAEIRQAIHAAAAEWEKRATG